MVRREYLTGSPTVDFGAFCYFSRIWVLPMSQPSQKGERPVGVPAALAWGMEGYSAGRSISGFRRGRLFHCARQQQNNAQEKDRYDHSAHPEPEPISQLQMRFCRLEKRVSVGQGIQSGQYFPVVLLGQSGAGK